MSSYEEKYSGMDLKRVDPFVLDDDGELGWLMIQLDAIAADIEDQLNTVTDGVTAGIERRDPRWFRAAERALREVRIRRQACQERRGQLGRATRAASGQRTASLFIEAARAILPADTIAAIWTRVETMRGQE
jgi:hypothetical protein